MVLGACRSDHVLDDATREEAMHETLAQLMIQERTREVERQLAGAWHRPQPRRRWRLRSPIVLERPARRAAAPCA